MNKYLIKVFFEHLAIGLTLAVSVVWMLSRGLSISEVAIIESISLIIGLLIDIPTGRISDKYGRKWMLVAANIFHALSFVMMIFAHSFGGFILAASLLTIGFALVSGAEEAYIFESTRQKYRIALSRAQVVDESATILGLLIASGIIHFVGLSWVFVAAAIVMTLSVFVGILLLHEPATKPRAKLHDSMPFWSSRKLLLKRYVPFLILFTMLAVYYEGGRVLWQPQLTHAGLGVAQLGLAFGAFKVASLIGAYLGRHEHFRPRHEILAIGLFIACSFLLISSSSLLAVGIGFVTYSLLENFYRIAESNYLQELAPSNGRAGFLSAANFVRQSYSIVLIPILGLMATRNVELAFLTLAALQLIALVGFWFTSQRSRMSASI